MRRQEYVGLSAVMGVLIGIGWLLGGPVAASAAGEADFVGLPPCRLVDTRGNGFAGEFGPPALATGEPRSFPLQGQCGIPTTAVALALNVTATETAGPGFLLLYPEGGAQPLVSTLNYVAGQTVANAAIVPLGTGGGLTVVAGVSAAQLVLDVNGYFEDSLVHDAEPQSLFVGPGAGNPAMTGSGNTAVGVRALADIATGSFNTAVGRDALGDNTNGAGNTAIGTQTLRFNTIGFNNTATGLSALLFNAEGEGNTATGADALNRNTTGSRNVALGQGALFNNTEGGNNIAIGWSAGDAVTTGNFNIHIGHLGVAGDANTLRLGSGSQSKTFIAGINGTTLAMGVPVLIDGSGQLGTMLSSRQVKTDIEAVGERSRGLHALRPVSFRYRVHSADSPVDYGLIAEEVAEVYPELVVRDAAGAPTTVRYHLLPALLLNELQRQERGAVARDAELQAARAELIALAATVTELVAEVARLKARGPVAAEWHQDR